LHILVSCFVSFPRPPFLFRYFGRAVLWRDPVWSNYQAETFHERAKLKWKKGVGKTHHVVNIGCDNLLVKPMLWTWWWAAPIIIHNLLYGPPFHANFWIGNFPFHVTWMTFGVKSLYILELGVKAAIALFTCIPQLIVQHWQAVPGLMTRTIAPQRSFFQQRAHTQPSKMKTGHIKIRRPRWEFAMYPSGSDWYQPWAGSRSYPRD